MADGARKNRYTGSQVLALVCNDSDSEDRQFEFESDETSGDEERSYNETTASQSCENNESSSNSGLFTFIFP